MDVGRMQYFAKGQCSLLVRSLQKLDHTIKLELLPGYERRRKGTTRFCKFRIRGKFKLGGVMRTNSDRLVHTTRFLPA